MEKNSLEYSKLAELYEKLEKTSSTLKKTEIMADFLKKIHKEEIGKVVLLLLGRISSKIEDLEFDVAEKTIIKAISKASGKSEDQITKILAKTGDIGLTTRKVLEKNYQKALFSNELTVSDVIKDLRKLAEAQGKNSQDVKINMLLGLLSRASPLEKQYLIRTVLGELRTGVSEGFVRNALAQAFNKDPDIIQRAMDYTNDLSEVALAVVENRVEKIKPQIFKPISSMLAERVPTIEEALKRCENPPAIEQKYDGMRAQIHKKGDKIIVFTRRLENVTKQFPDLVKQIKTNIKAKEAIIEGEVVAFDKNGRSRPFQILSQRIKRKYKIEKTIKEIPIEIFLFDCMLVEKNLLIDKPFRERRKELESIVKENKKLHLAKQIISDSVKKITAFYKEALKLGYEGIMIKNRDSPYSPGKRGYNMMKIKPTMETLDLVIVGGEWGEGKRAQWFGSLLLACVNKETGEYLTIGKVGSGLSDEEFKDLTAELKKDIIKREGKTLQFYPRIVVEVNYEEIQKSPSYTSGYALRFPRIVRIRDDRLPRDASGLKFVEELYKQQKGKINKN